MFKKPIFKNRIALKLAGHFAVALLVFAVVMGVAFAHFYGRRTVERQQVTLSNRAVHVAAALGDSLDWMRSRGILDERFNARRLIRYVNVITADDVWVVDREGMVEMRSHIPDGRSADEGVYSHVQGWVEVPTGPRGRDLPPVFTGYTTLENLPGADREMIRQSFKGDKQVGKNFDKTVNELMITATAPIYNAAGGVEAVLVLRTPVYGLRQSYESGFEIFLFCCAGALLLALGTGVLLSLSFTKPLNKMRNTAEKLAERDYTARCGVSQKDEVGELAVTLDSLAGRLELADEESQKTDRMRKAFIANISHELRTPVTVLRGSLEALGDNVVTDPEEVDKYYRTMYKETLFLQRLINDLLDLSRLQNADFPIEMEPVNFCEVIRDVARSGRQLGREKAVDVECSLDEDIYKITGDYGRLRQMLLIFVDNAVKFSHEHGKIEIILEGRILRIRDHGTGVKAEDLPYVFERFYKTRGEKNKSGSGLGLAIAREIAERHGMTPVMESVYGEGATVVLELPEKEPLE